MYAPPSVPFSLSYFPAQEIATLRREAQAFRAVHAALRSSSASDAAKLVFQKVLRLLSRPSSCTDPVTGIRCRHPQPAYHGRAREPPVPLDFDAILDDTFVLRPAQPAASNNGKVNGVAPPVNAVAGSFKAAVTGDSTPPAAGAGLKDQKQLARKDNVLLFISRYAIVVTPCEL
jgi:ubiquitin-like 1-activating enzyme E1 B